MENTENTFITLGGLRRFLENLNVDMNNQMLYINQQDDNILQTAKQYSDSQDAINLATARGYTNDQDNLTLSSAKNYTDSKVGSAINTASNDATTKSNAVQNNLNTHIANITDAHDMANRLQALKVAMQAYTDQGISTVVGGAPELLNTLYEFSNAIGNDPNYSSTMMTMLGQKLNSSEVVNTPTINKILRLNANAQYPPIVIAQDANNRFFTDAERTKLAGIANNANNYTHPDTHPVDMFTGVLPLEKGGTGTTSKQGIVQMLGSDGDKNSITDISNIFTFVFESGGSRCGYLGFNEIKTKVQWSTAELQNALANLPNI